MKTNLLFDFIVNKETNTIVVKKEFLANLELVWKAWTEAELLDQWWAPKPYQNETISMNFAENGTWHYAMISPEGEKHYCKAYYNRIEIMKMCSWKDAFCDENGKDIMEMPSTNWVNTFTSIGNNTRVDVVLNFDSLEHLETHIKMGFKEGFTMGLGNLDELLSELITKK